HRTVDDRPFGGGEGMVLKPDPIFECVESLNLLPREQRMAGSIKQSVVLLSAQGALFAQPMAAELAAFDRVVLICGRYEGVDERVSTGLADREVSVGDYVLSGGELAAAVVVDAVTRLLPGALGNEASARQESFSRTEAPLIAEGPVSTCSSGGLLDYPHYTRPAEYRGWSVPEVLVSGNHEEIRRWRRLQALEKTLRNRPEMLEHAVLSEEDSRLLDEIRNGKK
ncbi:MAG: tRNA (guanosine(37)-N1)-methyltransferase TrmD, partial [Terriglobales bacterium]